MMERKTRALRNNNPCNIRLGSRWFGLCKDQTDPSFCQFTSMMYGFRAFFKLAYTYVNKYHIRTIRGFIGRFAPPNENNTCAYIDMLSSYLRHHGYSQDNLPAFDSAAFWVSFALGVAYVETGSASVVNTLVLPASAGYRLAFGVSPKLA